MANTSVRSRSQTFDQMRNPVDTSIICAEMRPETGFPHTPFDDCVEPEQLADLANVVVFSLEPEDRGLRRDPDFAKPREGEHEFFGYSVAQIFLIPLRAQV